MASPFEAVAAAESSRPPFEQHISYLKPTNDFARYVNEKKASFKGRDGYKSEQHFIPDCDLHNYWKKPTRIPEVCKSYASPIVVPPEVITHRGTYLRVFSTLAYAGLLQFFSDFLENGLTDERFPTNDLPTVWADLPTHRNMFEVFNKHQWTFFPLILDSNKLVNTLVPQERILPIFNSQAIRKSDATLVSRVDFYNPCIKLRHSDNGDNVSGTYILKTYIGERHRQQYLDEFRAFNALQGNKDNHVIACYAAFRHGDTFNLVLQYVQGCNLFEFLQTWAPPTCARDVLEFWSSLVKIFIGLHHLHRVSIPNGNPARYMYQLVHQDIKLDNILLELLGHGDGQQHNSAYSFSPFIADLGNSHVGPIDSHNVALPAVDHRGNQLYCAPEATRDAGPTFAGTSYLTWEADIFSMGALLSDVATWVAFGQKGREEYHHQRVEETNSIPGFRDSGYEGAFHNGADPLNCVRATHGRIRSNLPPWDKITCRILDVIEDNMLTKNNRLEAKCLFFKLNYEIDKARKEQTAQQTGPAPNPMANGSGPASSVPSTPTPPVPGLIYSPDSAESKFEFFASPELSQRSEACSPMTPSPASSPFPTITQSISHVVIGGSMIPVPSEKPTRPVSTSALRPPAEIIRGSSSTDDYIRRPRSTSDVRLSMADTQGYRRARKLRLPMDPSVEDAIARLETSLGRRDHIFLVDDTATMSEHSAQIVEAFQSLAYVAKGLDPDDLELIFASEAHIIYKKPNTRPLLKILESHKYRAIQGEMETSLGTVINKRIIPRLPNRIFGKIVDFNCKPMTVFVFTDGKWGTGVKLGNGLDSPILTLMEKIKKRGLNRTQVMIQFLRFGDDEEGWAHLRHLDDFGKDKDCDIVDARDITYDDVSSIFFASFTRANDDYHASEMASLAAPTTPA